ncbi:gastrula zinc finger protein XlCGF26.1-like isoform X2 [Phlebotomus papatasi]|uniref:gastrula zinc finger protein XlCGF26.1-like isoform X2 n=1 Tax=Phlebotomus papatasi TaxID=29031 RepID=UPI0024833045|nr:gastrula zinc finger protein XlCGF26.1-like isoform X2 [Phlebotomus papatasi]
MEVKTEDDDVVFLEIVKEEYEIQGGSSTLKVEETEEIQKNEDHAEVAEAIEQPREVAIKEKGDPVPLSKIAFICPKCRKTFKNKGVLKRHLKWHSRTPKQYPCRNCEQIFPCYKTLSAHRQTHRLFECAKCGKCYDIKNSLKNHLLSNHYGLSWSQSRYTGGKFKCEECEKSFARKFYYNRHIEIHKEGQLGHLKKCPNCNKRFRTKPKLEKHQSLCNQAKICKVCNKSFKSFGHFIIHLRKHSDYKDLPPRLQCIYCKESVVLLNLSQHMRNYHIGLPEEIIVDGPYECTVCKKSFDDFDDLKNHAEKYLLDRIFHCAFCTKRFKSKSTIQSHMQNTHTRKVLPKFKTCRDCGETFHVTSLPYHRTRCISRPFVCTSTGCKKRFMTLEALNKHMKKGSEPLYSCNICSYKSRKKYFYKVHMMNHEPGKPDTRRDCPKCPLAFEDENTVLRHIRNYHMDYYLANCAPPVEIETIVID